MNCLRNAVKIVPFMLMQHLKGKKNDVPIIAILFVMPLFPTWLWVYTSGLQLEIISFVLIFYYYPKLIFHLKKLILFPQTLLVYHMLKQIFARPSNSSCIIVQIGTSEAKNYPYLDMNYMDWLLRMFKLARKLPNLCLWRPARMTLQTTE